MSLPFEPGKHKRAAVKIIDDRGIESLKVIEPGMMERKRHRPAHHQLALRGAAALLALQPREPHLHADRRRAPARRLRDRLREFASSFDDPGIFVEIPLVNQIRPRVKAWREAGYPGVTGITKRLLEHWTNPEEFESRRFFFCQLEAIETLIWLAEAPAAEKVGIDIPSDGGDVPAALRQDGDRLGQDHRHGDGHRLADSQQGHLSAGRALLEKRAS